jgi:hypothetical protein
MPFPDELKTCPYTSCTAAEGDTAVSSATDQMGTATSAIVRALRVRTVACSELHGSLLMQTVYPASGVYSERSRLSLFIAIHAVEGQHPRSGVWGFISWFPLRLLVAPIAIPWRGSRVRYCGLCSVG